MHKKHATPAVSEKRELTPEEMLNGEVGELHDRNLKLDRENADLREQVDALKKKVGRMNYDLHRARNAVGTLAHALTDATNEILDRHDWSRDVELSREESRP